MAELGHKIESKLRCFFRSRSYNTTTNTLWRALSKPYLMSTTCTNSEDSEISSSVALKAATCNKRCRLPRTRDILNGSYFYNNFHWMSNRTSNLEFNFKIIPTKFGDHHTYINNLCMCLTIGSFVMKLTETTRKWRPWDPWPIQFSLYGAILVVQVY